MNDRYLYRAKRIDNVEWVEGYLFDDGFKNGRMFVGGLVIEEYHGTACDDWSITGIDFYEVDPSTICQCTGLRDKNGKLIYENDILIGFLDNLYPEYATYTRVLWNNSGFCANENHSEDIAPLDEFVQIHFEVCGNIFDNPELLEVGE